MQFRLNTNLTVLIATGMVCATMLLLATFIWPTPYMYVPHHVVGINRFTGNVQTVTAEDPRIRGQDKPAAAR